jgi:hypothetical protein
MINIKDLNEQHVTTDSDLQLDSFANSENYLKELSDREKGEIHGGRWVQSIFGFQVYVN